MTIIIFSSQIEGHFLEFVHHLYDLALDRLEHRFVFLLPSSFVDVKDKFEWEVKSHITFELFDEYKPTTTQRGFVQLLCESYKMSKLVAHAARKYQADYVFSNTIINFVPFAPFFIKKPTKLIGIIYRIYLHDMDSRSKMSLITDKLKYRLMARSRVFHKLFILNDSESATILNNIYKTNKFCHIADPYIPILMEHAEDIRSQYRLGRNKIMFIHFGAMNTNKGTIEILESIRALSDKEKGDYCFFFAGRVSTGITDRFYRLYNELKDEVQIIVKDEFCSYEFFASLCIACDAILTPYRRTAQSSGLIGYASQFGKPVIAVNKGLLGQLVREYELGILIEDNDPHSLMEGYRKIAEGTYKKPTKRYCEQNSIKSFQKAISNSFV